MAHQVTISNKQENAKVEEKQKIAEKAAAKAEEEEAKLNLRPKSSLWSVF